MKILEKTIIALTLINITGAACLTMLPGYIQIALIISTIGCFAFFYLDDLKFNKKLEKVFKGQKVKF